MPQTEEQNKFGVKTVSCTVLFLDKCHYPMMLVEGSWQWINARKPILVFVEEAQCIRCDWLMTLQNIRWATDAWEPLFFFFFRKFSQIWQKMTVPGPSRLWKYKIGLWDEQSSMWLWTEILWALHVIAHKPIQASPSLRVMLNSSPGSGVEWCVHHVAEQSPCSPILLNDETDSIKASCCGSKGPAVRAVFMT